MAFKRILAFAALLCGNPVFASAKETPLSAIVLFDSTQGAAYVQIAGMTLNGKTEARVCGGVSQFDKKAYNAFPRASFAGATSLERGADGVLTLTVNAKPVCVVPDNLKFDKKREYTPAEAADEAVIQGNFLSSSALNSGTPAFKPGVQVVFVAVPDVELAGYLCAQRTNTVKGWQDFVNRYPSSLRVSAAQSAIAGLHEQAAEAAFAKYQSSSIAGKPDLAMLREARLEAQAANVASAAFKPAVKLMDAITRELDNLMEPDRERLQTFHKALQDHRPGYSQLSAARVHVEQLQEVRPDYPPLLDLHREIFAEEQKLEVAVANAKALAAAGRYDEALSSLGSYGVFVSEIPRVNAVVNAAYKYHFDNGQRFAVEQDWEQAATEFRKAAAIRPESNEAGSVLNNAIIQLNAKRDRHEAELALQESDEYASKGQFVEAYTVLDRLPDKQRALVISQLSALTHNYVSAATRKAEKIQELHVPIRSRSDEDAVLQAYALLDRASSLSSDPAITLKRDFLSSKISAYYADQASRYLEKPSGSGAGVGMLYLKEAQGYGVTNLNNLKDQIARYTPLYQRRAHLSVGIMLRDQTSRRDSPGFADQLADAIANGLESSGLALEVVRNYSEATDALQPNFMLVGEVLEHGVIKNVSLEAPQSKYRAGTQEIKNPAWLQARSDYESAQQQLAAAQHALADTQSQHKKKDIIAAANEAVQQAQQHQDDLQHKMEATEPTVVQPVVESYHYTKKTIDLSASVELAFHIDDRSGNVIGHSVDVHRSSHNTVVVLQDVKPEDTEGITNQGMEPNEAQFLADLEIEARNAIVKAVREQASALPARVLQEARTRAQQNDVDGAAEEYVIFLNSAPGTACPERDEAVKFLHDRFNLTATLTSKL